MSYLPHFVAKTERSLRDFAGDLEEGSLLCLVRALQGYLEQTKSAVVRASTLFVSPCYLSCAISKNALSYFLREVFLGLPEETKAFP